MLDWIDISLMTACGALGGFLSGFLGVGGGIVYIPILSIFLPKLGLANDVLVKCILANSLFTIIFSGIISSVKQYQAKNFFPREIVLTAIPGVFTALVLTWLINSGTWYSKQLFNYVFSSMMLLIMLRMFIAKPLNSDVNEDTPAYKYNLTGFFTGMITAFSGLGGGVVMTPVITDVLRQSIRKASSISNGVIPMFAMAIGIYNISAAPTDLRIPAWHWGYVVLPVVLPMIAATFIFAPMGVKMSVRVPQRQIRLVFATFVGLVFIKTVYEIFLQK